MVDKNYIFFLFSQFIIYPDSNFLLSYFFESRVKRYSHVSPMCTIIPRCIHELHLFNAIFIMVYEMSVVFTVCCVAPPGVRNEIRYQLTNPLNVICFRTDILRPSYNPTSGSSFLLCQSWYRFRVLSLAFLLFKKRIIFRYLCNKKFVISQELSYEFPYPIW